MLVPLAVLVAVLARPIATVLLGADAADPAQVDLAARFLLVFAPQVVLYGIGIVLTGVLQAYRRFAGPAIAPLLSSLVVAGAYLLFAGEQHGFRKAANIRAALDGELSFYAQVWGFDLPADEDIAPIPVN